MVSYSVSAFVSTPKQQREGRLVPVIIGMVILTAATIDVAYFLNSSYLFLVDAGGGLMGRVPNEPPSTEWVRGAMEIITIASGDSLMV